jgi:predicted phosphodiesterase
VIVAVFSDVHGNLPALEAFARAVEGRADRYLCLGDSVNYGPWNDECLELIWGLPGIEIVEGNHDRLFLDDTGLHEEIPLVQEFYQASHACFTRRDLLADLPASTRLGPFRCEHTIGGARVFADTDVAVECDYLIGHSHWQFSVMRGPWRVVNPGSIGQNRHRIDHVDFALYDTVADRIDLEYVGYDVGRVITEMRRRHWPEACIGYYERKLAEAGAARMAESTGDQGG